MPLTQSVYGQLTPQQAVAEMGRGINLGNTLEPPFEGGWNNGPAQEHYFDDYVTAGFATVRIPVRWDEHTSDASPFAVDAAFMDRVEQVVDWGLDRGLYVILNTHHDDWIKSGYSNPTLRARFDSIWVQIADRFKDKSEKLLLEIINEPFGMTKAQVDDMNERVLGLIRQTNPTRIVVYCGNDYSASANLMAAAIPDDDYLIGYYHSYDPWEFAGLADGTWGTPSDVAQISAAFTEVSTWSANNNMPIIISEFGAVREADYNSRMLHYATYVEESVKNGIPFQAWDDGGDFEVYERPQRTWNDIRDILLHVYPDSPTRLEAISAKDTLVSLSWTNRTTFNGTMTVERRSEASDFVEIASLTGTHNSYDDTTTTLAGTFYYRVTSQFSTGPKKYSYPIRVAVQPTSRSSFGSGPFPIPGTIEAEDYDVGGEGLTYHDTEPANIPGAYRPNEGVDIEPRDDGGFHVAYIESAEWLEYTVDVQEAGIYEINAEVASLDGNGRFRFEFPNANSSSITVPDTDSWQTTDSVKATVELEAGEQIMRVYIFIARPFNIDRFSFRRITQTGVEDAEAPELDVALELYPNPSSEDITVVLTHERPLARVVVYNVLGQRILETPVTGLQTTLKLDKLAPGTYVARLVEESSVLGQSTFIRR